MRPLVRSVAVGVAVALVSAACVGVVTSELDPPAGEGAAGADAADASTAPPSEPAPEPAPPAGPDPASVGADELGHVPVLMYHRVVPDPPSTWDVTPDDFRAELVWLFDNGYRPVRAIDLVRGELDVPAGTTPVVLTFDDSARSQARLDDDGAIHPESAAGILIEVAALYDDVDPVATFYVNGSDPFGADDRGPPVLRALAAAGFELGNHSMTHANLGRITDAEVRRELALAADVLRTHGPGVAVASTARPYGSAARDDALVVSGSHAGIAYAHEAIMQVDPEPARSPFHVGFDPLDVPRICSSFGRSGCDRRYGSRTWLDWLDEEPGRRYVSDGDPARISFPRARTGELAPAFRGLANPY
jgi:hypothetical protein